MAITKIHPGKVKGGKFIPQDPTLFKQAFYAHEGKVVELHVQRKKKKRSIPENNYYWGTVVHMIAEYTGFTPDEVNDFVKVKFLGVWIGKLYKIRSTKDLNTVEFEELMEKVRTWASMELSLYIPLPNEVTEEK